ncbi:MAG: transglycosylase SLT domain-containing protein [Gammaproteobacteria bacterium]|nr:transglycosylase SLT domain-containing protein [Gammaproteobacteria bacterium]
MGGIILALAGMFITAGVQADIYKYVDKHGRVILTDKPTHKGYKRLVKTWKGWVEVEKRKRPAIDVAKNRKKFSGTIDYFARQYRLPTPLLHAVITAESSYDPDAVSRAGAVGLMQLMPGTAKRYGVKNRRNPYQNIKGGTHYLRDLLGMFDNNLVLALAAYNAGENAVKKYGNKIPPYKETQTYVRRVLSYYKQYKAQMKS